MGQWVKQFQVSKYGMVEKTFLLIFFAMFMFYYCNPEYSNHFPLK